MSEPRFTALRFDVPGSGPALGFAVTPTGRIDTVCDDLALRQSLLLLLSTAPGERVMRPAYGCPLDRFVFAPNDDTTAGLVMHEVQVAIARCEPRVEVLKVDAGVDPLDDTRLAIALTYRVRATAAIDTLTVPVPLQP